ncbi:MAG: DUF4388 domain-containing protein [Acidobacteriota bacterium]
MGISGNLKTMVLPELLQWLSMGTKSGTLVIDNGKIEKKIFFQDGAILSSASTDPTEYLGRFLASHGYLPEEQIEEALARQKTENQLLGQILVNMGAIAEDDLQQMLRLKTEESIYDIFTWEEGDFKFLDNELPEQAMVRMALDVQGLVLEGSRRLDEWSRIRELLPSVHCVPVAITDLQNLDVDELDLRILEWVDDDRSVEEISQGCQTSLFFVASAISNQVREGTVKAVRPRTIEIEVPVEVPVAAEAPAPAPAPVASQPAMPQPAPAAPAGPLPTSPVELSSGRSLRFAGNVTATPDAATSGVFPAVTATGGAPGGLHSMPAAAPAANSPAASLVQEAEDLLERGDLEAALAAFRKAQNAPGSDSSVVSAISKGERRIQAALELEGIKLSTVPKLECSMAELTQLSISPQEGFMLTRVDGSYDLKSILKMSPMPPVDAQMLVWRLKKLGHVTV